MNFKYYKSEYLIPFILSLSVIYSVISDCIEKYIKSHDFLSKINDYVDVFSTISLITLTILFINYFGWRFWIFKWLVKLPNLNGRYKGLLVSSFLDPLGNQVQKECVIEIEQNASSIHIYSYYGDIGTSLQSSWAHSISEEIVEENNGLFHIYYIYSNEPGALFTQLNKHAGTAIFKYYPDIKVLEGNYYNQRKNVGTMRVTFQQKKILHRLV